MLRKAGHMTVFGILAVLIWWAVARSTPWPRAGLIALALAVAYAVSDEVHQGYVPGRHASAIDVAIDGLGAAIAVAVGGYVLARRRRVITEP